MSHNKLKIGTATPNKAGEMTVGLNDLSDVSAASPATDDLLQYNSTTGEWSNAVVAGASAGYIWIGGKANDYSNSPASSFTTGQTVYIWDDAPINTISGSTISVTSGSGTALENDWVQTITLPAGKYVIRAQTSFEFSASGYGVYQIFAGSTAVSGYGVVGTNRGTHYGPSNSTAIAFVDISTSTTYNLEMTNNGSNIDTVANQGNTPSEYGLIYIEKLA
jgi:hypothetical protein